MYILVTGGAGFIGSHLIRQLLEANHTVVVLDDMSTGSLEHLSGLNIVLWKQDLRNKNIVQQIVFEKFDVIVHLAAQTMVDVSLKEPFFDASENIMGTLNVLDAARQCGSRVIFASTAAAYGDVAEKDLPVKEAQALHPQSFYGLTKVGAEKYLQLYHDIYGLDYVVCRFANVYGERQGDKGEGGVISIFAKRIATGKDITILGDGKQTRDFIYAGDIARGICKAMITKNINTAYNLSTQRECSLLDLVKMMSDIMGEKIEPHFMPEREGDIYRSVLSNEKANLYLDWQPEVSLKDGLAMSLEYFRNCV